MVKLHKNINGYLIINMKTKNIGFRIREPKELSRYEIPVKINLNLDIPEQQIPTLDKTIKVPDSKLKEIFIEEL